MNSYLLKNGWFFMAGVKTVKDILIEDGVITKIEENIKTTYPIIDCSNLLIAPAFIDPHVHLREPGFPDKETIATGTKAALKGGYTTVFAMPNLNPVCDSLEHLDLEEALIKENAVIEVLPVASITKSQNGKELSDIEELAKRVIAFSDDGHGFKSKEVALKAIEAIKKTNRPLLSHVEDIELVEGGVVAPNEIETLRDYPTISNRSEYQPLERELNYQLDTKIRYHICHVSTKESIDMIRYYKKNNPLLTCEVTPHHLILSTLDLENDALFKVNPPIRSLEDVHALREALKDGTIDMIATDHAPHTEEEKKLGFLRAPFGISGIEVAFSLLYTEIVLKNIIPLDKLLTLMSDNVSQTFGLPFNHIKLGNVANLVVIDLETEYRIDRNKFISKGKNTPFENKLVKGEVKKTIFQGSVLWDIK
ncbi:MAG: dihydroorotase [Erysipelotrichales bacterium]|nr:dihydroorotase [Erysipelotrichales bacterium]